MKKKVLIITGIVAVVLAGIAGLCAGLGLFRKKGPEIEVSRGRIHDIKTYVRLCSVEVYSEVPVLDTINNKVIFAIQKQNASISFDVENLRLDTVADTLRLDLPKEIIEVYESTEPRSWEVIDTKNISTLGFLKSSRLTAEEENAVKSRIPQRTIRRLYSDGTVARARREAADNLSDLLRQLYRQPVVVTP